VKHSVLALGFLLWTFAVPDVALHASDSQTVFRAGVDIVGLNVVVTDGQQRPVNGLTAEHFTILEDGVPQQVSFFAASQVPLDLAILLDTSASMSDKLKTVQDAAIGFAMRLRPSDRVAVVAIKDSVKIVHPLDEHIDAALAAIRDTTSGGGTSLYNGLYMSMREMIKQRRDNGEVRRQAIAVLTDGDDTASLVSFDDVMEVAKQAGIAIYTITLKSTLPARFSDLTGQRSSSESEFAMKALALETGARSFAPSDITELAGVYGVIAEELASQYSIGYISNNPRQDGAFRKVVVRVDQPGARTRTRSGYLAPRPDRRLALQEQ
jgi:Ca-activated chloride channel homolog